MKDLTLQELSDYLLLSRRSLLKHVHNGKIKATKPAGKTSNWLVSVNEAVRLRDEMCKKYEDKTTKLRNTKLPERIRDVQ